MRAMVTAWSLGDDQGVEALDEPHAFGDTDPAALVMTFASTAHVLVHELRELTDGQFGSIASSIWDALGTR
jgi:hypothetical protein